MTFLLSSPTPLTHYSLFRLAPEVTLFCCFLTWEVFGEICQFSNLWHWHISQEVLSRAPEEFHVEELLCSDICMKKSSFDDSEMKFNLLPQNGT